MTGPEDEAEPPFPPEMASETIARLYESQGRPEKAASIRALIGKPAHLQARARDGALEVTWHVSDPEPGPLLLRLVTFAPGGRTTVDTPAAERSGTIALRCDPGWTCVAIGRLDAERFVPLAHAPPVRVNSNTVTDSP